MKIASWNINSVRARLPNLLDWLNEASPDVLLLQEIKCQDKDFPAEEIGDAGYNIATFGQKSYNGVAILAKSPIEDVLHGLPGDEADEQARYIEATVGRIRVASIYLPNGNPVASDKYPYKLAWMRRLARHARALVMQDEIAVLGGDYNVCPEEIDVYDPKGWTEDALFHPKSRAAFRVILNQGYTEAFRALHPGERNCYTFWDYQGGAWQKDNGLRIDHMLLAPLAADRLLGCDIDRKPRGREKASDHTPIWCEIAD
ncbi:MAG: exodeoxyribonuclease III [Alphaproteobacteria bacterium]|nr:exodeoxyribonuclease III [Alphaproteobacteria bacterium]